MSTRWFVLALLVSLLLLAGNLPGSANAQKGKKKPADPLPNPAETRVGVTQPIVREVTDHEDFTGRVDAMQRVELRPRVTGYIVKISYKPGTTVKEGDVLFEIDPRPYQAQYDQAMSQVALCETTLKLATAVLDRLRRLNQVTPGSVGVAEFDNATAERDKAAAALDAAKAALQIHKLNLDFTKIKAPIAGKIGQPALTPGNLVVQDQTLLATIISTDPVYVYFDMDERTHLHLGRLKRDDKPKGENDTELPVHMRLADETDFPHQGKVDLVATQVNPGTGTVRWRAVFANPDGLFMPGMFARVRLTTSRPYKALLVPDSAVQSDEGHKFVFVVNEKNVVERRPVTIGGTESELRIVTEGLKESEWVVKAPTALKGGETVVPEKLKSDK